MGRSAKRITIAIAGSAVVYALLGGLVIPGIAELQASRLTPADLQGTYRANFRCGLNLLRLRADGRYEQCRQVGRRVSVAHTGPWELDRFRGTTSILLHSPADFGDWPDHWPPSTRDQLYFLQVRPLWGKLSLVVNEDLDECYERIR